VTVDPVHHPFLCIAVIDRKHQKKMNMLPGKLLPRLMFVFYLCLLCYTNAVSQTSYPLPSPLITIHVKDVSLDEFIQELRKQVKFQFIYSNLTNFPDHISLQLKQAPLTMVLDKALHNTGWEYLTDKDMVIIRPVIAGNNINRNSAPLATTPVRITGTVTSEEGGAISRVSIKDAKSNKGTWTDEKGVYTWDALPGTPLIFSCLGFENREIITDIHPELSVRLKRSPQAINEVIITGYQQIKGWEMTGAVYKTSGALLRTPGINRVDQALRAQIPGASITLASGGVGATPSIRIRGTSTLLGNREPIWVIDGIVRESPFPNKTGNEAALLSIKDRAAMQAGLSILGNAVTGLNPDDIAEVIVLKDAAATAIYGARAANGVIVITTRKGKAGPPQFNIRTDITVTDKPSYNNANRMNAPQRIALSREIFDKGIIYPDDVIPPVAYEGVLLRLLNKQIDQQTFNRQVAQLENTNTNWFDVLFRNAVSRNIYMSMSGGDKWVTYFSSFGRTAEKGNAIGNEMSRISGLFRAEIKLFKFADAGINLSTSSYRVQGFFDGLNPYEYALNTNRSIHAGEYYFASMGEAYKPVDFVYGRPLLRFNFLNELAHTGSTSNSNSFNVTFSLNTRFARRFRWESVYASGYDVTVNRRQADERSFAAALLRKANYEDVYGNDANIKDTYITNIDSVQKKSITWRNTLHFYQATGQQQQSDVNAMIGTEMRKTIYEGQSGNEVKISNGFPVGSPDIVNTIFNFLSFYGSISYAFRQKYIVSFNARTDASNRFAKGSNHRFNPVWSAGLRWNLKQETWLQSFSWLDNLALRADYGYQGNTMESVSPHLLVTNVSPSFDPYTGQRYLGIKNLPYTDLRWERTRSVNAGVDVALFHQRLRLVWDYYYKISADVILKQRVPEEYGLTDSYINGGEIHNKGWELALNWVPVTGRHINWQLQLIAGCNDNEVYNTRTDARTVSLVNGNAIVNGKPVGGLWSFSYAGLSPKDGQPLFRYLDVDKDRERLLYNTPTDYLVYNGSSEPVFSGGLNSTFRYKRFSLATSFNILLGYKVRLNPLMQAGSGGYYRPPAPDKNVSRDLTGRWQQPGDEKHTDIPSIYSFQYYPIEYSIGKYFSDLSLSKNGSSLYRYDLYNYSDLLSVNASNLRCNYITLGYSLDSKAIKWLQGTSSATISISVNNAFVISDKRLKGQDPEMQAMSATENSAALPFYRSYVVSVSLKL
jgi:TonB-linked SusC/RagA family outer membrane protein